ncbi:MAG TPA: retropepsin-like aspartic protease [Vicinamibacterales bacterium]|nr:retropepsin-like aspartic protease [Vicinamibacterales bacterium]
MTARTLDETLRRDGYTGLPLTTTGVGQLATRAKVNGIGAWFLVDTGASTTVIDRRSADRFGLRASGADEQAFGCVTTDAPGQVSSAHRAVVNRFELGGLVLEALSVHLVDLCHVNTALAKAGAGPIDGVLGGDLMVAHGAVIAYPSQTLHLKPGSVDSGGAVEHGGSA